MKKKILIVLAAAGLLLAVLLMPVPGASMDDGGTRAYTALTYKIVDWNRLSSDSLYDETKIYWFPNNFKSVDALWELEAPHMIHTFTAKILEVDQQSALVQPILQEPELESADKIRFAVGELEDIGAQVGSFVEVSYTGSIMETYPAQIHGVKWEIAKDLRTVEYTGQWLDKEAAEQVDNNLFDHILITEIYSNCFFARTVIPMPYTIKLNGQLSEDWCVGDQVACTYENTYYDSKNNRVEVDFLTVEASDWEPDPFACYKPVIYLYPEQETAVSVKLDLNGKLTCTYPVYKDGWQVIAAPDGALTDGKGQIYNYLYWEGETYAQWDMSQGFCIKGEDTAAFLEQMLAKLGLNRKEANEFIVYWLPLMEQNPYNVISFQTDVYTRAAALQIDPVPDTVIRVFMTWKAADDFVQLPEQVLQSPERRGFTVVEWGGTEIP